MKKLIGAGMALSLLLAVAPAMATDDTTSFVALSQVTLQAKESLPQMPDDQLAAVEGQFFDVCTACFNLATVTQNNSSTQTATNIGPFASSYQNNYQSNYARVRQNLNN
jgi:hypothetical protein